MRIILALSWLLWIVSLTLSCSPVNRVITPESTDIDLNYPVGPFTLIERSGKTITDQDLIGSVWIASFVFTRCSGPCPAVTATVARLQSEFRDEPGVKFVTFTVDPKHDDLTALRAYALARNADPQRWLFLTGDEDTIHRIIREQFKQAVERNLDPHASAGEAFDHSTRLVVVDRRGVIRATYQGLMDDRLPNPEEAFEAELTRLRKRVRELLRE
ncbi:MAG: SCO family protein [Candidatus Bilamarchaeaceae archaeon]